MRLRVTAGVTVVGRPFQLPTAPIDFIAGAILIYLAGHRILISRSQPPSTVPLSPGEKGALVGFVLGGLPFVLPLAGSPVQRLSLVLGLTHWAPLGLVIGALLASLASGISRGWRRPT